MFSPDLFKKIFKAYDIRGTYPDQINAEFYYAFGKAFANVVPAKEVAVGRDMRTSGDELFEALTKGLTEQGVNVVNLGKVTSDMVYFACGEYEFEAGIMITASHNPAEYNGLKACLKHAVPLPTPEGKEYERIQEALLNNTEFPAAETMGTVTDRDISEGWIAHLHKFFNKENVSQMNIVVDTGNGMAGPFVEQLMKTLPQINYKAMYFEPDGTFPNHPANPIEEENLEDLKKAILAEGADLGLAFDGDGDRVFLVDDEGVSLPGTISTAMVAKMMLTKEPGQTVLYNAICGKIVPETVEAMGGTSIRTRVGHTFIKQAMKQHNGLFAGEHSGHYFFRDNWNADSGIIMAVILLEMISKSGKKLSELRKEFEKYVAIQETNFRLEDIPGTLSKLQEHFASMQTDDLDGLSIYGDGWWCNIRPSNTEPLLRLNLEADNEELLTQKTKEFEDLLNAQ